jgi:hypothetical protein
MELMQSNILANEKLLLEEKIQDKLVDQIK